VTLLRLWSVALLALCFLTGCPTPPPPQPPPQAASEVPSDPAPVVDDDLTVGFVHGLKVMVKQVEAAELGTMQLYVRGGARFRTAENAGLDSLSVRAAVTGGTQTLDKDDFDKELFELGTEVGATALNAYSMFYAKALSENMARSFELLADVFIRPALPAKELELQRARLLTQIKARTSSPDGQLAEQSRQLFYAGHPYEHAASGTDLTVNRFTRDDLVAYMASLRQTSRLAIVVVGPVDYATVAGWVKTQFGELPRGTYTPPALPPVSHAAPQLRTTMLNIPTTYVESSFSTPGWEDPGFAASILAIRLLRKRLFDEVRTKRSLSYAPTARHSWTSEVTRGSLYVSAENVNETMKVMFDEVEKLKTELIGEVELRGAKSVFITSTLMANESTDGQASFIALCALVGGDHRLRHQLPERIKAVTPEQIRAFARKYLTDMQTVVVGATEVDPAVFPQK